VVEWKEEVFVEGDGGGVCWASVAWGMPMNVLSFRNGEGDMKGIGDTLLLNPGLFRSRMLVRYDNDDFVMDKSST